MIKLSSDAEIFLLQFVQFCKDDLKQIFVAMLMIGLTGNENNLKLILPN